MKFSTIKIFSGLLLVGLVVASCASKKNAARSLPVSDPAKVKRLSDNKQLEKQVYFSEAMKHYEMYDWETAEKLFRKTISIDPGCDACFYELANIYFRSGYLLSGVSLSESAVRLDSSNFWYRVQLAQFYAAVREYDKSTKEYEYLLTQRPGMEDLYFDLTTLYIRQNRLDSALTLLDSADRKIGYSEQSAVARFEILRAQEKNDDALTVLERLTDEFPEARYYSMLGEQYANQQRDSLALQMYDNALAIDPDYTPALLGETDFYRRRGLFDTYFAKMYVLYANKNVEQEYKIDYLSTMMQIPQFTQTFASQMDTVFAELRTPPDSLTEPLYASYLMQTRQIDSAVAILKNNVHNNLNNLDAWQRYLAIEYYVNEWDTLNNAASKALEIFPDNTDFMSMKAIALWQTNREKEAITWLEKTLPLTKDKKEKTLEIYSMLGDLYHSINNSKKAYEYYEKALAIDSTNILVLNNYAYYLSEENKNLDKAYAMSKKAIEAEPDNATYLDTFGWILYKMGKAIEAKAIFRHAMLYGGKESAVILDHYGDVLNELGEKDMAVIYWDLSIQKEPNPKVSEKIKHANK